MFLERQREPDMPRAPILPSARQQELHNITHQPFQPWCEACVLGRSRQSPHIGREGEAQEVPQEARPEPMIQIDYAYTFTKQKHEVQEGEADAQSAPARQEGGAPQAAEGGEPNGGDEPNASEPVDYRDQFGLTFFAAESSSGWISAVPILEKGAGSLKRVTEAVVRLSLQVSPCDPITVQGDPEPSVKQALNAIKACRARLGLVTNDRLVERGPMPATGRLRRGSKQCAAVASPCGVSSRTASRQQSRGTATYMLGSTDTLLFSTTGLPWVRKGHLPLKFSLVGATEVSCFPLARR